MASRLIPAAKGGQIEGSPGATPISVLLKQETVALPDCAHTFGLTLREAEVLAYLCRGKTNKDIGAILRISPRTVQKHLEHVFQKFGVETRTAAAIGALERLLIFL